MSTKRALLAALGLLLGTASPAPAEFNAYQAKLEDAGWRAVDGQAACHLFHEIPLLATVVLSEDVEGGLSTTLLLERPAGAGQQAGIYRSAPVWKPPRRSRLARIALDRVTTTLGLAAAETRAVSAALEAGDRVDIQFRTQGSGAPKLAAMLSPVQFRAALAAQRRCLARLRGSAPPPAAPATQKGTRPGAAAAAEAREAASAGGAIAPPAGATEVALQASDAGGTAGGAAGSRPAPAAGGPGELPQAPQMRVYFSHDDAGFDRADFDRVRELAARLRRAPFWSRVQVVGHADATGSAGRNRSLALARAIEVRNRLIQEGLDPQRIQVSARGEDDPAADNTTEYGRARNRRVEIRAEL